MTMGHAVDFTTTGEPRFTFERIYTSDTVFIVGPSFSSTRLGKGWRSNFDSSVYYQGTSPASATSVHIALPNGVELNFIRQSGQLVLAWYNKSTGAWVAGRKGLDARLAQLASQSLYQLTLADDTVYTYDYNSRLVSIARRGGYTQTLAYDANGNNTSVADNLGRLLTFTYTPQNLLSTVTAPDGSVTHYGYLGRYDQQVFAGVDTALIDKMFWVLQTVTFPGGSAPAISYAYENITFPYALTGITDERGVQVAAWAYGDDGRALTNTIGGSIGSYTFAYNNPSNQVTLTNPLGKNAVYQFTVDSQGQRHLSAINGQTSTNCGAFNTSYGYDANGFLSDVTDGAGRVRHQVNDSRGRPIQIVEGYGSPVARTAQITWHATYSVPSQLVEPGRTTNFSYDPQGRLLSRTETDTTSQSVPYSTNGRSRTWSYTYNSQGLLASVDGPRADVGGHTQYSYTAAGYLESTTNALGHVATVNASDGAGRPLSVTDSNGVVTTLAYDARGRLISATVGGSATTTLSYDPTGLITGVTLPAGATLSYGYDSARRLISVATGDGDRIESTLDALGGATQIEVKSADGTVVRSQSRAFDELGRLLRLVGAGGETWSYAYDASDNVTSITDPRGNVATRSFDALNRLVSQARPLQSASAYGYDGGDRVTLVTDPGGLATAYTYDGFGDLIQESSPDRGTRVYEVDLAGNRTRRTDARGVATVYGYDALNRLTSVTYPASPDQSLSYAYDDPTPERFGIGRLASVSGNGVTAAYVYDARGNRVREARTVGGITAVTSYAYDAADAVVSVTYPSGRLVSYARDNQGRVSAVTMQDNAAAPPVVLASAIAYDPFGPVASLVLGNGLSASFSRDRNGRLTGLALTGAGGVVRELAYTSDATGNVTAITDQVVPGRTQSFQYDALDRLTGAQGAYGSLGYGYDATGTPTWDNPKSSAFMASAIARRDCPASFSSTMRRIAACCSGTSTRSPASPIAQPKGGVPPRNGYEPSDHPSHPGYAHGCARARPQPRPTGW
jgi:YD repeat-containing protein